MTTLFECDSPLQLLLLCIAGLLLILFLTVGLILRVLYRNRPDAVSHLRVPNPNRKHTEGCTIWTDLPSPPHRHHKGKQ